jgi:AcrR family transcriptional regulator
MRKKSDQTQRRIIEAAYFLFYRKGFTRVSMDEIAARAKLTKRTLYLYFRSKDDLLASTLRHYSELDRKRLQAIADRLPADADKVLESIFAAQPDHCNGGKGAISGRSLKATEFLRHREMPAANCVVAERLANEPLYEFMMTEVS